MADLLIYQTSDPQFANRAVDALREAGIDSYSIGEGARELNATLGRWTDSQICIYIRQASEADSRRANEILVGLGGAMERPLRLPKPWLIVLIGAVLVVLGVLAATR